MKLNSFRSLSRSYDAICIRAPRAQNLSLPPEKFLDRKHMPNKTNKLWKKFKARFHCCYYSTPTAEPIDEPARAVTTSSPARFVESNLPPPLSQPSFTSQAREVPSEVHSEVAYHQDSSILDTTMQRLSSSTFMKRSSINGHGNGYANGPESPSSYFGGSTHTRVRSTTFSNLRSRGSGAEKTSIVRDTAMALKRKSASALGAGISDTADSVGFINLVEWIRTERLQTLPHKGSKWDTVLIRALYFAERLHGFETALTSHALDVEPAAQLGYGHIKLLLEVRPNPCSCAASILTITSSATKTPMLLTKLLAYFTGALQLLLDFWPEQKLYRFPQRSMSNSATYTRTS